MTKGERRAHFRQGLSKLYLPYYDALCGALDDRWQPYFGVRSFQDQDVLYAKGRTAPPIGIQYRVTNARGGESPHQYGCATDWTFFQGETLMWLKKADPLWQEYIAAIEKVGLKPGASFGDVDHNEIDISCDWKHVLIIYKQNGMTAAQQHIEANLIS